jgi:hypothetical protein
MLIFAVRLVELLTVVEFTVMPAPQFTLVTPALKFVPVNVTSSVCRRLPDIGEMLVNVGTGLICVPTVNPPLRVDVPPPGVEFVTLTERDPSVAPAAMVMFAVKLVELFTVVEFTVMPAPKSTDVVPAMKFEPVRETFMVLDCRPLEGVRLDTMGGGFITEKPSEADVPPPGAAFEI